LPAPVSSSAPVGGVALPGMARTHTQQLYEGLDSTTRAAVDNLTGMGFSKDRVIQAVHKLGGDEKEVCHCQIVKEL